MLWVVIHWTEREKGRETGEDPQVPAWRGRPSAAAGHNMQVQKGTLFTEAPACAQPSMLPAGLQLGITVMALSFLEWPTGGNSQGHSRQPRGSGTALECFHIGKSGLVIFHQPTQSSMLMGPKFSICTGSKLFSLALRSPFKQAEDLASNPPVSVN